MVSYDSTSLAKLERLKTAADRAKVTAAKLEGQLEQVMGELKSKGFDSLESAREGIKAIEAEITKEQKKFDSLLRKLEGTYGDSD